MTTRSLSPLLLGLALLTSAQAQSATPSVPQMTPSVSQTAAPRAASVNMPLTLVNGVLQGTIVDWPTGTSGTLRLSNINDAPDLADTPIGPDGRFSLKLPAPDALSKTLARAVNIFIQKSNYGTDCQGQGLIKPADSSARYNFFDLTAFVGSEKLAQLKFKTDAADPTPVGSVFSNLMYFDAPVSLDGTVTCKGYTDILKGSFPAGWLLVSELVQATTTAGTPVTLLTPGTLPSSVVARLYTQYIGIGASLDDPKSGTPGLPVVRVLTGRPAAQAGLQVGDLLVSVNGQDVSGQTVEQVVGLIRAGAAGSTVVLGVKRGGSSTVQSFTVMRASVQSP